MLLVELCELLLVFVLDGFEGGVVLFFELVGDCGVELLLHFLELGLILVFYLFSFFFALKFILFLQLGFLRF